MKNLLLTLLFGVSGAVASHGAVYDITAYGAVADTTRLSTSAIQQAIDACNAAGGGEVLVPAGAWKTGSIFLKSNVTLRLENGATLYGSTDIRDYTPIKTDYVSLRTHTPPYSSSMPTRPARWPSPDKAPSTVAARHSPS